MRLPPPLGLLRAPARFLILLLLLLPFIACGVLSGFVCCLLVLVLVALVVFENCLFLVVAVVLLVLLVLLVVVVVVVVVVVDGSFFALGARTTRRRSAQSTNGHAPHCTPKTAESALLHAPLSTRLDEISSRRTPQSEPFFGPFGPPGRPRGPLPPSNCAKIAGAGGVDPPLRPPPAPLRGTWAGLRPAQSP